MVTSRGLARVGGLRSLLCSRDGGALGAGLIGGLLVPLPTLAEEQILPGLPVEQLVAWSPLLWRSFVALAVSFVVLLLWEVLASRGARSGALSVEARARAAAAAETQSEQEADPFKALLQRTTEARSASDSHPPPPDRSGLATPYPPGGAGEEPERASAGPSVRGSEGDAPSSRATTPSFSSSPARPGGASGASDWASLLSKVQGDDAEAPPAGQPAFSPRSSGGGPPSTEEEDPWKKLLGTQSGPPGRKSSGEEASDPWQSLLKQKEASAGTPATEPPSPPPSPPPSSPVESQPPRIALMPEPEVQAGDPPSPPPSIPLVGEKEPERPRSISLDLGVPAEPSPPEEP